MARRTTKISTTGKPWARYLRLSKAEAEEVKGLTPQERLDLTNRKLDDHLEAITAWMESKGLPYDDDLVFRDPGLSAWKPNVRRPQWEAMMEEARRGEVAGIAVVAVDRYTRQVSIGEDLIRLAEQVDIRIGGGRAGILDLTTYEGITQLRGMVQQAANESLSTSFRLQEKLASQARKGKPMGGGRQYGFEVVGDKYVVEMPQVPEEVAVIREVAQRVLDGEEGGLQAIAADLNERGLRTTRGKEWTGANLGRLLTQKRYGGEVELHGQVVGTMPGEPVLDRDIFDAIQALFASRRRGRRPTAPYLLTGILACSDCGRTMNGGSTFARADGSRPRVYKCPKSGGGCARTIMAEPVEELVGQKMVDLMADPANAARIAEEQAELTEARKVKLSKVDAIKEQLVELEVKWASGETIPAAYAPAKATLDRRLAQATAELAEVAPVTVRKGKAAAATRAKTDAARVRKATEDWRDMEPDERRHLIREYGLRPVVDAKRSGTRRTDLGRVRFA